MSNPFVAEIRIFPFNFPPKGWAFCDGQLLPISQNTALFSLLGTFYGGDGKSTFALPNLQGNAALHTDSYSGGGQFPIGAAGGASNVTLIQTEIPAHSHFLNADAAAATTGNPAGGAYAEGQWTAPPNSGNVTMYTTAAPDTQLAPTAIAPAGSSFPHNNMQPYLTLNFCIALQGVFPARP
jgi:microcystin-dependent protein